MSSSSSHPDDALAKAQARIAELEGALKALEQKAHVATQELQHFVYAASHDLQEPLRAISTYSQLLERLYPNDEQSRELITFITTGVSRMNALLQNLLTYSRVNATPKLTTMRLSSAVQSALFKLAAVIKDSGATIRFSELPEVEAHEIQMGQLFEHILLNALIYRRQQPEIKISAEQITVDGRLSQLVKVKDNGLGIERQFLNQVILPFKRLHGKDYPGNGLGLAICDKIMRAHGGKLWLESDGETGTTVNLVFPC